MPGLTGVAETKRGKFVGRRSSDEELLWSGAVSGGEGKRGRRRSPGAFYRRPFLGEEARVFERGAMDGQGGVGLVQVSGARKRVTLTSGA
jgi:hypothetical protein